MGRIDQARLETAAQDAGARFTVEAVDIEAYLASQVADTTHREVAGPLSPATGASGVVIVDRRRVVSWGDPAAVEMTFSVTKTVVSLVAGVAFDDGLLRPDEAVHVTVPVAEFEGPHNARITWRHLLQQTSQWEGTLWGKPTSVDAQSYREGTEVHGTPPGEGWAYNDVRMNLLCYALTLLFRRSLPDVLRERVMDRIGASPSWSWHGYTLSTVTVGGEDVEVVSGGAHWGGGLFINAEDLAAIGQLFLTRGLHHGRRILSQEWIEQSWTPCPVKPECGYLWWLNDRQIPWPGAPATGRSARGNGGRHLLWVDPDRDLVLASHWTNDPLHLIRAISDCVATR
ncbi:serine hydrolase [Mobilicoccus sp.]|uniref:serine hydrolase domain-containing protein n=1 Tax=Mobilicoccus sp. TaxID=2034349 RepID=UPI0028ADDE8B|nr:serine hydrolase [Mobilicoccus sp.]